MAILIGSEAVQSCISDYEYHYRGDNPTGLAVLGFMFGAAFRCIGHFLHDDAEELLVLGTGFLAWFTFDLWNATVDLAREAHEASNAQEQRMAQSVAESARAATAMERQTEEIRDNARRELRAYLGMIEMKLIPPNGAEPLTYSIRLKNFGKTPAFSVSASMTRKILRYPLPDDFQMEEDEDRDDYRSFVTLQPTHKVTISSSRNDPPIPEMLYYHALNGRDGEPNQTQIYCFGTIRYRDVFGTWHWAHYSKSFGGGYYHRNQARPSTSNVYNDSSDDPQPGG
jgi:hypothetical protein